MAKNAYIHIPFCKGGKCNYCSFTSFDTLELKEKYIDALISEIKGSHEKTVQVPIASLRDIELQIAQETSTEAISSDFTKNELVQFQYQGESLETLYFGGGTPSVLTINEFKSLIELFNIDKNTEVTTEINPDGIDKEYLIGLKTVGINRISIGSQSFDDNILKLIGRKHNSEQIKTVVNLTKKVGFDNISLDLIYGLPTQDLKGFEQDLETAIDLNVRHISLYGLKIEEGCYFHTHMPLSLPDSDLQADMYLRAVELLKENGFEHYEISNFSKPNFNSKHNLNYWKNNTYYGFGCSASGYIDNTRYTNEDALTKYIKKPNLKISEQKLTKQEILEEAIFLGLRKLDGINTEEINKEFGIDFDKQYAKILDKYLSTGHLIKTLAGYALSIEGILVSNEILAEFIT